MIAKSGRHISRGSMPAWRQPLVTLTLLTASSLVACGGSHPVPRKNGDTLELGRTVPPQAYAWYSRGLHFEHGGHLKEAELAFQAAIDHDRESGAAWAALVRVRCETNDKLALEAAAQGLRKAQRLAPVLSARAACLLRTWGSPSAEKKAKEFLQKALDDSQRAVDLEPAYAPATRLTVRCLNLLAREEEARRWERAYRLYASSPAPTDSEPDARSQLEEVDEALRDADLGRARQLAVSRLTAGQLALRALAWAQPELAQEQAAMTLNASPDDPDALLVRYLHDGALPPTELTAQLGELGTVLLARALQRSVSRQAALLYWNRAWEGQDAPQDALLRNLAAESNLPLP